jgi:putative oxidoreductase
VTDNILSAERMAQFAAFLNHHGFILPGLMAPLSVWVQCLVGLAFIFGLFTRWAGLLCSFNFVVAIVMVDAQLGIRAAFPATCLVLIGLYLATRGAGALSLDALITRRTGTTPSSG